MSSSALIMEEWADAVEPPDTTPQRPAVVYGIDRDGGWYLSTDRGNSSLRDRVVAFLARRYGRRCWYCGKSFGADNPETLEHLVPLSRGGPRWELWNLRLAHEACNRAAGCKGWGRKFMMAAGHEGPPPPRPGFVKRWEIKARARRLPLATLGDVLGRALKHGGHVAIVSPGVVD